MYLEVDELSWRESALCAQVGGEIWFPEKSCLGRDAIKICGQCPVSDECLEYALSNREFDGIWGGTTPNERRKIMRRRKTVG